jgi:glutathione S-transferase
MARAEKRLYRFPYSCYARKVQALLAFRGEAVRIVDVRYGERGELVRLTGGSIHVPVLVLEDGTVLQDSRRISELLVGDEVGAGLVPAGEEGPAWAFADWCDQVLEDAMFRLAAPGVWERLEDPWDRALFTLVKERKYGTGCLDRWRADQAGISANARALLAPVAQTLAGRPFVLGERPTLADAALYGQLSMLAWTDPAWPGRLAGPLAGWFDRIAGPVTNGEVRRG